MMVQLDWLRAVLLAGAAGLAVSAWPGYREARNRRSRQVDVTREFPETVDLLCICVEAGMGFQAALDHVTEHTQGTLAAEWRRVISDVRLGDSLASALSTMALRNPTPEVRHFVASVNQSQELGLSLTPVLRAQADHARETRRLRITEQAHKIPIKVLFPLIACLLPALLIVVVGPAALTIADQLSGT
jgi:tight adherence protein C